MGNDITKEEKEKREELIQEESGQEEIVQEESVQEEPVQEESVQEELVQEESVQEELVREESEKSKINEHLKKIEVQVENAKRKETYETYHNDSAEDGRLRLYIARRKGVSHFKERTLCQDYCLSHVENGYSILADADGVGSCKLSDIGSRLACESVVSVVNSAFGSGIEEEEFVSRLLSVTFREKLVSSWIKAVMNTISDSVGEEKELSPEKQLEEFNKYGTTLMFAVITPKWIVTGNIGDGQVLVFNDSFGINLRAHEMKQGTKVSSLLGEKCAREDFQIAKYPREIFDGVLLSTDGMYDSLGVSDLYYQYASELKKRFLEKGEPYQPFCFQEKGEPYKDFSRMRTFDDCSIAMALDVSSRKNNNYDTVCDSIINHGVNKFLISRWSEDCMYYFAIREKQSLDILVSTSEPVLISDLKSAVLERPAGEWSKEGLYYSEYNYNKLSTLELLFSSGKLKIKRSDLEGSKKRVWNIYKRLVKLQNELKDQGLEFNSSAGFNTFVDESTLELYIRHEAVSRIDSNQKKTYSSGIDRYFEILLGAVVFENLEIPIFDIGYVSRGTKQYDQKGNPLFLPVRVKKNLCLKNISSGEWIIEEGEVVKPGELMELKNNNVFTLIDENGKETETYVYGKRTVLN